jgi:hypothetical protein
MPAATSCGHRGYLLHLTHYDPVWWDNKKKEKPFDMAVARDIVAALVDHGFNMLLIGVSDGVRYRSHPELRKHYSQPMTTLRKLADLARKRGLQIVPKLNFSRSEINRHNQWMRRDGQPWHEQFDDAAFWKLGFQAIDEVVAACRPESYFHVGMDEDHDRSHRQYIDAMLVLLKGLAQRGLRTVSWSDSAIDYASADHHREKSVAAEKHLPADMVRILWNYWAVPTGPMKAIRRRGMELWGAPGARTVEQTTAFRDAVLACGGTGLVMTHWIPCIPARRKELLDRINTFGPLYR